MDVTAPLSVVIVGAGPAGLSAALWCKQLGLVPIIIEKAAVTGGMLNVNFLNNDWVLGLPDMNGVDIARTFHAHIEKEDIPIIFDVSLVKVEKRSHHFFMSMSNGECIECQAVIIATGTDYIGSEIFENVAGFLELDSAHVVAGPYAFSKLDNVSDSGSANKPHVAIVGAGDNAFENALLLLERGCRVSMIARSAPKAQKKFSDVVMENEYFTLHEPAEIIRFSSCAQKTNEPLSSLSPCLHLSNGHQVLVDRIHILAGYYPNSASVQACFSGLITDANGFLVVDSASRTPLKGVYAAGDICNVEFPCVVSAISAGALAAKTISRDFLLS